MDLALLEKGTKEGKCATVCSYASWFKIFGHLNWPGPNDIIPMQLIHSGTRHMPGWYTKPCMHSSVCTVKSL